MPNARFIGSEDKQVETSDVYGVLSWISRPGLTDPDALIVLEQRLEKGQGPVFHLHPDQEEIIFVRDGSVEQWLGEEQRTMNAGDYVFIPAGLVHRTKNISETIANLIIFTGPTDRQSDTGVQFVDVSSEAPWNSL